MSWVSGLGSFFGAGATITISILVYLHGARKDKHQIDIALLEELRKKEPSRYLVERLFFYLYRCSNVSYDEIIILINHTEPREAIRRFSVSRRWSRVFRLIYVNGNIGYELYSGFDTRFKRGGKCVFALVMFFFMYLLAIYFGNKSFSILAQVINDFYKEDINFSDGFERLFSVAASFSLTVLTGIFSGISILVSMSTLFSLSNAKEIIKTHKKSPCKIHTSEREISGDIL
ncbi:Uncharacterised protein [Serratia quinivorans]|uniref:hypothetical protein n=1 Tax=Serratia quinivorans TaxID=137545 RepID=UPI00217A0B5C|nr:hypothetical protein [Serratia quinivorans]CAI1683466.1 Uncharacterised protein [Serratia quinivorans]CAI1769889.1 Uncharacterised protein [Serratia quinivorans]CAI2395865.1 Uncharacterised protein [Serratia quinivorans]